MTLTLVNGKNVVLNAPIGSGKLLVCYLGILGINILRKMFNLSKGVGVVLQPLNNILIEKTNNSPPIPTAYMTTTGEGMKSGN